MRVISKYPAELMTEESDVVMHMTDTSTQTAQERVQNLAAIPEASTPSRRSKRRVDSVDQASLERAEKLKAARNLDSLPKQGTNDIPDKSLHFSSKQVYDNLNSVGICLGVDKAAICNSVDTIKSLKTGRLREQNTTDLISTVFDLEEKEIAEEVDKLILNVLCSEIMDEVLDMDSAHPRDGKTIPRQKSTSCSQQ
jgi:hypothetical protein